MNSQLKRGRGNKSRGPSARAPGSIKPEILEKTEGDAMSSSRNYGSSRKAPITARPPRPTNNENLASNFDSLQISPTPSNKLVPMQRPDQGGSSRIQSINLFINHFPINYDDKTRIFHYEFILELEKPPKYDEISKSEYLSVKNKLFNSHPSLFPQSSIAYDGHRYLYSAAQLPGGKFKVELHRKTYIANFEFKKELLFSRLKENFTPREVLQGLDIITYQSSIGEKIARGRSLYSKGAESSYHLGRGIVALPGSKQTIQCTELGPMLFLDLTIMPCIKAGPVLNYLEENLRINFKENTQLSVKQKSVVESALKGSRVVVRHRSTKCKFVVNGLTNLAAKDIVFKDDSANRERRLLDYYKEKHKVEIRYKRLPCLDLSREYMNYVPMELCEIVEGHGYPKDDLKKDEERKLREMSSYNPKKRKEMIMNVVNAGDGPCSGELTKNFSISIAKQMTQISARVLDRPSLKLANTNGQTYRFKIQNPDGQYSFFKNKLPKPQRIENWAILDFSSNPENPRYQQPLNVDFFIPNLARKCHELGIRLNPTPLFVRKSSMSILQDSSWLYDQLVETQQFSQLDLLICPMSDKHPGYKTLKLICETELGILTQCCLSFYANNVKKSDQYFGNLALKINAKLGGSNMELFDGLPRISSDGRPFMLVGADVNHPASWNKTSPSIAAMVATMNWPQSNRYASRVRAQTHRVEKILDAGAMFKELVDAYLELNGVKPKKIIYFRDGIGNGQFDMVLNEEIRSIKSAIQSDDYSPTITVIIAQKRHHTRFFPTQETVTRTGNVPPGTVVDKGIVDPATFNFYLCSHYGSLGTSKPTHYHVLYDEHGFSSAELQMLVYNLCFTFARCTKPVSLVTPVYYADVAAYRGRMYYEAMSDLRSPSSSSTSSGSSSFASFEIVGAECRVIPRLHWKFLNGMCWL